MTDKEIVDCLHDTFLKSLVEDIPRKRERYEGSFADGYIEGLEGAAKHVLKVIEGGREDG